MKLEMLKHGSLDGNPLRPGDTPDVSEDLAQRWVKKGIAKYPGGPGIIDDSQKQDEGLEEMTKKDLLSLADEAGLDVKELKRLKKAEIIYLLEEAKEEEEEEANEEAGGDVLDGDEEEEEGKEKD